MPSYYACWVWAQETSLKESLSSRVASMLDLPGALAARPVPGQAPTLRSQPSSAKVEDCFFWLRFFPWHILWESPHTGAQGRKARWFPSGSHTRDVYFQMLFDFLNFFPFARYCSSALCSEGCLICGLVALTFIRFMEDEGRLKSEAAQLSCFFAACGYELRKFQMCLQRWNRQRSSQ